MVSECELYPETLEVVRKYCDTADGSFRKKVDDYCDQVKADTSRLEKLPPGSLLKQVGIEQRLEAAALTLIRVLSLVVPRWASKEGEGNRFRGWYGIDAKETWLHIRPSWKGGERGSEGFPTLGVEVILRASFCAVSIGWQGWRVMSSEETAYGHLLPFWVILKAAFRVFWEARDVYSELIIKRGRYRPSIRRDAVLHSPQTSAIVDGRLMPSIASEGQESFQKEGQSGLVTTLLGGMRDASYLYALVDRMQRLF